MRLGIRGTVVLHVLLAAGASSSHCSGTDGERGTAGKCAQSSQPACASVGLADYVIWRTIETSGATTQRDSNGLNPSGWRLFRQSLPTGQVTDQRLVRLAGNPSARGLAAWRGASMHAGSSLQAKTSELRAILPSQPMFDSNFYGRGILAVSPDGKYVMSFLYNAAATRLACPMGFARYRLSESASCRSLMQKDFCWHALMDEFSGFVRGGSTIGYFVKREFSLRDLEGEGEASPPTRLLSVDTRGRLREVRGESAHGIAASPNGERVVLIQPNPGLQRIEVIAKDALLAATLWRTTISMETDDFHELLIRWSMDGCVVAIAQEAPGGSESASQMTFLAAEDGRLLGSMVISPNIYLSGAFAIVRRDARFDAFEMFAIETCGDEARSR